MADLSKMSTEELMALYAKRRAAPSAAPAPPGGLPNVDPATQRARDDKRIPILQAELAEEVAKGDRPDNVAAITKELAALGVKTAPPQAPPVAPPTPAPAPPVQTAPGPSGQAAGAPPLPPPTQLPQEGQDLSGRPTGIPNLGPGGFQAALEENTPGAMGAGARFMGGIGSAPMQAAQSIQQLAGVDVPEHKINETRALASGWAGGLGNVAGNVGMAYSPFGVASNIAKNFPMVAKAGAAAGQQIAKLPKAVQAALAFSAAPAAGGLQAGALTPVTGDEDRLTNAGYGALFTKAGQAAIRAGTGLVKPTKEALELIAKGIVPTVGQGGRGLVGALAGQVEEMAANLPLLGRWLKKGIERPHDELMDVAASRAQYPQLPHTQAPGRGEFFKELADQEEIVRRGVTRGQSVGMRVNTVKNITDTVDTHLVDVSESTIRRVKREIVDVLPKETRGSVGLDRLIMAERALEEKIQAALHKDTILGNKQAEAFKAAKDEVIKLRDKPLHWQAQTDTLNDVQQREAHRKVLLKAADYAKEGSDTSAQNLIKAVEASTPPSVKATGAGLYQDLTDPFKKVAEHNKRYLDKDALSRRVAYGTAGSILGVGSAVANPIGAVLAPALYALAKAGTTRTGAKMAFGETLAQRKAAEILRSKRAQAGLVGAAGSEGQRED